MWPLLTKLVPVLLATVWPPRSPLDLTHNFQQVYRDLEQPGSISKQVTPTLRFSYVSPPVNGTSTWKNVKASVAVEPGDPSKPLAVYLPGLDGYGISAQQYQFDDLADTFEFWRLTIDPLDTSSFAEAVDAITGFVEQLASDGRQVVLIGESCGGLLASALAFKLKEANTLKGLVLVNPATSFDQTMWDSLVPLLTNLKVFDTPETRRIGLTPYSILGSLLLSGLIPDSDQFRRIVDLIVGLPDLDIPPSTTAQAQDVIDATMEAFEETEARLPPEVLEHRIQWLMTGTSLVNARLKQISVPTVVVAGDQDRLLPSAKEAERLVKTLPNAAKVVVGGRGHFVLDQNVNLTEAILYSDIDPLNWKATKNKFDIITDWKRPSPDAIADAIERFVKLQRGAHSPVYFSTNSAGKRWRGLSKIPRPEGPLLVVANHQFGGLDLRLFVPELFEQRNIFLRGLAHPVTFAASRDKPNELGGRTPGIIDDGRSIFTGDFQQFGAVEVTPRNYYRLMQTGQDALLFPGGAKEALSGRTDYPLFWPYKVDFVRTAARFNATVVPLSAIGMVDCVEVLAEPQELADLPFIGDRIRAANVNASIALLGARYDEADAVDLLGIPLALPKLPARNYFLCGKPVSLHDVDPNDKEACARVYREIEADVRRGLDDLLRARELDPFKDFPRRIAYERVFGKIAPTFPVDELNKE